MISRYSRPEMASIWSDQHRYAAWLRVELAVCAELARAGMIPRKDWQLLNKKVSALLETGGVDPKRVDHFESITRHDVIAFTTAVAEKVGPSARFIHFGLTSSDVVDTALSLMIQEAGAIVRNDILELLSSLGRLADRYRDLPTIGRSHGISAEPTSFGLKFLGWEAEWRRNLERVDQAIRQLRFGKLSGAVGVNAHWDPGFEERVLARLDLLREPVSTQVIPRDRHAGLLMAFAVCGSSLERMAVELRHLQRSEVSEVREGFSRGQKGSSAMPHKRNPISSENISGLARLLRSYSQAALENVPLWHERDISHSSVERVVFPDSFLVLDYALARMRSVLEGLEVDDRRVVENLEKAGATVFSGHYLLELVKAGVSREQAYAWVQECALASFDGERTFIDLLQSHPGIAEFLPSAKIRQLGSLKYQLRNVRAIYQRVRRERGGRSKSIRKRK
ncbi:MAG: adenylosuccinate lyase [Bdellovibrionales bacterium GWB1_55_8]|nr:MAG: adenylosuccinate lyase [Bdellovibrionales bacterium GWB1_55_8]